jgi:hypothetical protein
MNEMEEIRARVLPLLTTVFAGLFASGFRLPLQLVMTAAAGGFLGFRLEEDGSVVEEFCSEGREMGFPLVVQVFDDSGKRHQVTIVNDCEDHEHLPEKPMQEVFVQ